MWFRIAEHFSVAYVNDTVSQYRVSPNSMSSDLDRMWNSQMYFLKKHLDRGAVTRSTYREALATVWRDRGDVHFRYGTLRQAIYCYARSVGALPFDPGNWYPLILAVGVPVARALPAALLPERVARLRAAAGRADLRSTDAEAISIHNRGGGNFIFH
jgi:hypothetical protein